MDEMRETPSNALALAFAKALRATREKVRPTAEGVLPAVGRFATDAILPEGGIDELENWAYGNSPLHIPEMSNIPQFKGDTKGSRSGRALDAASLVPIGTAAKAAGTAGEASLIFPIIKGLNKNPAKEADLLKAAELARVLRNKGANFDDVWHDARVTPILRTKRKTTESGRWGHEVDFAPDMLKPEHLLTENERIEQWIRRNPGKWAKFMSPNGGPTPLEMEHAITTPTVREGTYNLPDLVDNPELFAQYPDTKSFIADMREHDVGPGALGQATGSRATVYQPAAIETGVNEHSPFGTLTHELQHLIQTKYNMPRGGSPAAMRTASAYTQYMRDALKTPKVQAMIAHAPGNPYDPVTSALRQLDRNIAKNPFERYLNIIGEQQSRAAAERAFKVPASRDYFGPHMNLSDMSGALDADIWQFASGMSAMYGDKVTENELADMLIDELTKAYAKP